MGAEFQVNTYTNNHQSEPSVTSLIDGGFLLVWRSDGQDGNNNGIYAQRYDANGNSLDGEFQVNTYTGYYQEFPSTAALEDGGFVITWTSDNLGNGDSNIYAQRFDASGDPVGSGNADTMNGTASIDVITAYGGDDILTGLGEDDILDGGTGQDTMTGGTGTDTFVVRDGDGNADVALADIITDFTDGEDLLGGAGSVDAFSQLTVAQGTGANSADTVVSLTSSGEVLALLENFTASNFDANDFVQLDIL